MANIEVAKLIMQSGGKSISPQLVEISAAQKTDLKRVIYANAITLTPGTVSVELSKDKITVHALTESGAKELAEGSMAREVSDLAGKN